jgi:small GTP-binding protein
MKPRPVLNRFLLLVVLASLGLGLVYIPPRILEQYETLARYGRVWVYVYFSVVGVGGLLLLGCTVGTVWQLWARTRRKTERQDRQSRSPSELSREQQQVEIAEHLAEVVALQQDRQLPAEVRQELQPLVRKIEDKQEAQTLEIVAFGTVSSGKSSLLNALAGREVFATDAKGGTTLRRSETPWPGIDRVTLVDTPGWGEVEGAEHIAVAAGAAKDADVVLVTVDGPLRKSEFDLLEHLGRMEKKVLICLNKADWYDGDDRALLLAQIREQVRGFVAPEDLVAVRAQPVTRSRVRVLPDGTQAAEQVPIAPDISALADRMLQVVRAEGPNLLLANLLLQSRGLVEEARRRVQEALDRRADEIVERYMWGAGSAAALSPFPLVDLVAGCAISTKLVVELGRVYHQDIDLNAAVSLLGELGKNLLAILGLSVATPAVATAVASLLKTVPGAGLIVGGALQGLVQALITRWIGRVFQAYFRDEMRQPEGGLVSLARREWQRVTTVEELRRLVKRARECLREREA